ncbi:MAG TPA: metal-dependent transcriptional regulator [Thermoleophilia bacterium]|nr:metal-dependent transcriptional regulator [Thermoleophilia bacterium]
MSEAEGKRIPDRAAREYLKQIFKLEEREGPREGPVQTSELAHALGLTAPAVTDMAKKLAERGFVDYTPYHGLRLTAAGRREATRALRRHRIVERLLTDMLGFPWSDAHELAVQFEHEMPEAVEERLYEALHRPADCPHGFPIPDVPEDSFPDVMTLDELRPGEVSEVATVLEEGPDILGFIESLGLRPGARVEILQRRTLDGPLVARVAGVERTVGENLARIVTVRPVVRSGGSGVRR